MASRPRLGAVRGGVLLTLGSGLGEARVKLFRVWGFGAWGLGFRGRGLGFRGRVWDLGVGVLDFGVGVWNLRVGV